MAGLNVGSLQHISNGGENVSVRNDSNEDMVSAQRVRKPNGELTLNLSKGLSLDLTKEAPTLKSAFVGLGWDPAQSGKKVDLDLFAFLVYEDGQIHGNSDVVYFRQKNSQRGVYLDHDNRDGVGEGDDERIFIQLDKIPFDIKRIAIFTNIYEPNNSNFGMVKNVYTRLVDKDTNKEICTSNLCEEGTFFNAFHIVDFVRKVNDHWTYETIGKGCNGDINQIGTEMYM